MSLDLSIIELENALGKSGCPICTVQKDASENYLRYFLWENVNDSAYRTKLVASLGFCAEHTLQLSRMEISRYGDTLGFNIVYSHMAAEVGERLKNWEKSLRPTPRHRKLLNILQRLFPLTVSDRRLAFRSGECPACQMTLERAGYVLKLLVKSMEQKDSKITRIYPQSDGLCLRHLQQSLEELEPDYPQGCSRLVADALQRIEQLTGAMEEYVRKQIWENRAEELTAEEDSAWRKMTVLFSGVLPGE